jgi:hypothetical protein
MRLCFILFLAAVCSSTAYADEMAPLAHNGSTMLIVEEQGRVQITYEVPRARLSIREGTILFVGSKSDPGEFAGTAYTFKKGCPPAPYAVSGRTTDGGITLVGRAPRRDRHSCMILPGAINKSASTLVFKYEPD